MTARNSYGPSTPLYARRPHLHTERSHSRLVLHRPYETFDPERRVSLSRLSTLAEAHPQHDRNVVQRATRLDIKGGRSLSYVPNLEQPPLETQNLDNLPNFQLPRCSFVRKQTFSLPSPPLRPPHRAQTTPPSLSPSLLQPRRSRL